MENWIKRGVRETGDGAERFKTAGKTGDRPPFPENRCLSPVLPVVLRANMSGILHDDARKHE
jgi:hypothetical protein